MSDQNQVEETNTNPPTVEVKFVDSVNVTVDEKSPEKVLA